MNKNIVIFTYFANTNGQACSHHIDDRIQYFIDDGYTPIYLTSFTAKKSHAISHYRSIDFIPSALKHVVRSRNRASRNNGKIYHFFYKLFSFLINPFLFFERLFIKVHPSWWWSISSTFVGLFVVYKYRPCTIYSTGGPISAHISAGFVSKMTNVPWVAEFQDPLIHSYCATSKTEYKLTVAAEKFICKNAQNVVFLTKKAMETAASRTSLCDRGRFVYPGANKVITDSHYVKGDVIHIVHFGSLVGPRNLKYFIDGLEMFLQKNNHLKDFFCVDLYGELDKKVLSQIKNCKYDFLFKKHGKISREKSIELMHTSDFLLLVQGADDVSIETIPSKNYEYMHTGRPIFALVYKNDELTHLLESHGHIAVSASSGEDVCSGLERCFSMWKTDQASDISVVESEYTVGNAVKMLESIIIKE